MLRAQPHLRLRTNLSGQASAQSTVLCLHRRTHLHTLPARTGPPFPPPRTACAERRCSARLMPGQQTPWQQPQQQVSCGASAEDLTRPQSGQCAGFWSFPTVIDGRSLTQVRRRRGVASRVMGGSLPLRTASRTPWTRGGQVSRPRRSCRRCRSRSSRRRRRRSCVS